MTNEEILDQPNTWRGDGRVAGAEPSYVLPAPMQLDAETRLAGARASRAWGVGRADRRRHRLGGTMLVHPEPPITGAVAHAAGVCWLISIIRSTTSIHLRGRAAGFDFQPT
jgi:hypothetical protein